MKTNHCPQGGFVVAARLPSHRRDLPVMKSPLNLLVLAAVLLMLAAAPLSAATIELVGDNPALPTQAAPGSAITIALADDPGPGTQFQWLFNDAALPGATGASLALDHLTPLQTGNYRLHLLYPNATSDYSNTLTLNVVAPPPSPIDLSFAAQLPTDVASARPVAVLSDQRILVRAVLRDGSPAWYRLQSDGHLDSSFNLPASAGAVLATASDGAIIVANSPYRYGADGSPRTFPLPAGFASDQPLAAAAFQSDGKFLIAQGTQLARLNSDGTPDATFVFANTLGATIDWLKFDASDRLIVHGFLLRLSAGIPQQAESYYTVERLTSTGADDPAFVGPPLPHTYSTGYFDFTGFSSLSSGGYLAIRYDGAPLHPALVRLHDDGSLDADWSSGISLTAGVDLAVDPAGRVFTADVDQILHRYTLTATTLEIDATFYQGQLGADTSPVPGVRPFLLGGLFLQADGQLLVGGNFARWDDHVTPRLARIRTTDIDTPAPAFGCSASNYYPHGGERVTLDCAPYVAPVAPGPLTYQWLALDGQPLPADTTSAQLVIASFTAAHLGRYQVRVTGPGGTVLATPVAINVTGLPPYLVNLSGRAVSGTGEDTVIAGVTTKAAVKTLFRGAGPALVPLGVGNALPDPTIKIFDASGTLIASNDNWGSSADSSDVAALASRAGAFPFGDGSLDAASVVNLPRGGHSVHLSNQGGGGGVGLLEVYADPEDPAIAGYTSPLINLSLRARTAPGEATAMAGVVIVDPLQLGRPARVLLRAIGPTLSTQGIVHPLDNPVLTVYNSKGEVVAQNDDWAVANTSADAATLSAAMTRVGAFHLLADSKDAGLLLDLPAGAYTMHATGGTGIVLLEIYLVR